MHHKKNMFTRHRIQSGVWNGPLLGYHGSESYTISRAIRLWYENISKTEEGVGFREACTGVHCSRACPEQILLELNSRVDVWSVGVRIAVAAGVLLIAVSSLVMKVSHKQFPGDTFAIHVCRCSTLNDTQMG